MILRLPLLLLFLLAGTPGSARAPGGPREGTIQGMALVEIHPGHGFAPYDESLDGIRRLGAEWVMLPVTGYVDSAAAPRVDDAWEPPTDMAIYRAFVGEIVRAAHAKGLGVTLIPYLNVRTGEVTDWRGNLRPPDWPTWFKSYEAFLDGWVELADREGIEILGVGAELVSSESHPAAWRALIGRVRARYGGRILYSCNWDHYRETPFLESLDLVGVSGYYSLPWDAPPTEASLVAMWQETRDALLTWRQEIDRPFLFTEVGYPSIAGSARDPWNYLMEGPADPEEQARALEIFCETWAGRPELTGVFFWNWSPFRGGPLDRSYSVRDKPAAGVVRKWFDLLSP